MEKLSEKREILCDETGRPFKERFEQLAITEDGVKNLQGHKYYHCDCGSLIRTLPEALGRCHVCGRSVCPKCYSGLCGGKLVCSACCGVKSGKVEGAQADFICFSCRARQIFLKGVSFLLQKIANKKHLPITRR